MRRALRPSKPHKNCQRLKLKDQVHTRQHNWAYIMHARQLIPSWSSAKGPCTARIRLPASGFAAQDVIKRPGFHGNVRSCTFWAAGHTFVARLAAFWGHGPTAAGHCQLGLQSMVPKGPSCHEAHGHIVAPTAGLCCCTSWCCSYTPTDQRPLWRRRFSTLRPLEVFRRLKYPYARCRLRLLGWYWRLIACIPSSAGEKQRGWMMLCSASDACELTVLSPRRQVNVRAIRKTRQKIIHHGHRGWCA